MFLLLVTLLMIFVVVVGGVFQVLTDIGERITEDQLHDLIAEVDTNQNSSIEFEEFLELMSALKTGAVANSRLDVIVKEFQGVDVGRSGGGL